MDRPLYLWALWRALRHFDGGRLVEPDEALDGWHQRQPDDAELLSDLTGILCASAGSARTLPAGLRVEVRATEPGLLAVWGGTRETMAGMPSAVSGPDLVALARELLAADDQPAPPTRPATLALRPPATDSAQIPPPPALAGCPVQLDLFGAPS